MKNTDDDPLRHLAYYVLRNMSACDPGSRSMNLRYPSEILCGNGEIDQWLKRFVDTGAILQKQLDYLNQRSASESKVQSLPRCLRSAPADHQGNQAVQDGSALQHSNVPATQGVPRSRSFTSVPEVLSSTTSLAGPSSSASGSSSSSLKSGADAYFPDDTSYSFSDNTSSKGDHDESGFGTLSPKTRRPADRRADPQEPQQLSSRWLSRDDRKDRWLQQSAAVRRHHRVAAAAAAAAAAAEAAARQREGDHSCSPPSTPESCCCSKRDPVVKARSEPRLDGRESDHRHTEEMKEAGQLHHNCRIQERKGRLPLDASATSVGSGRLSFSDEPAVDSLVCRIAVLNEHSGSSPSGERDPPSADSPREEDSDGDGVCWPVGDGRWSLDEESRRWKKVIEVRGEYAQLERTKNGDPFRRGTRLRRTVAATRLSGDCDSVSQGNGAPGSLGDVCKKLRRCSSLRGPPSHGPTSPFLCSLPYLQLKYYRKWAYLRLTSLIEKFWPYKGTRRWDLSRLLKRIRHPDYRHKRVFGMPVHVTVAKTGSPIPAPIRWAMHFLMTVAVDQKGLFRRPGSKSRIQKIRALWESGKWTPDLSDGTEAYDIADLLKQYLRSIPGGLLTTKLADTFLSIFTFVPEEHQTEALQAALILLPDENREALHSFVYFLSQIAKEAASNQMTAHNLAICVSPSVFLTQGSAMRRRRTIAALDAADLAESRAAVSCLSRMISDVGILFRVPQNVEPVYSDTTCALDWSCVEGQDWVQILQDRVEKELGGGRRWVRVSCPHGELCYRKPVEDLRVWQAAVEVDVTPEELVTRYMNDRVLFDPSTVAVRIACPMPGSCGDHSSGGVFQYLCASPPGQPPREFCLLRHLASSACGYTLTEASVLHPSAPSLTCAVRALVLGSRLSAERCPDGRTRVVQTCRVDYRGRGTQWDARLSGQLLALCLARLRESFLPQDVPGSETRI